MKVSSEFRVQKFLGRNIIIPKGQRSWNTDALLILSDHALFALQKLSGGIEKENLIPSLQEKFGITEKEANKDVILLLMTLTKRHLLEEE